jgi:RNA polymerase sigma-70 factor (ECF subfamily)
MSLLDTTETPDPTTVFETYHDRIYRYVSSMMQDPVEAEDLTQETFLRAYTRRDTLRDGDALTAWLYQIATNICLDKLRARTRRAPLEADADPEEIDLPEPDKPSVQKTVEQREMSECVQMFVARLPDSYRVVLLLHDVHGLTAPEIGQILSVPLSTVKIRLHRARVRLQEALKSGCTFSHDERDVLVCDPRSENSDE